MDAIHIILGRFCQYNIEALYKVRQNQYIIKMGESRVTLMPLLPECEKNSARLNLLLQSYSKFLNEFREERV